MTPTAFEQLSSIRRDRGPRDDETIAGYINRVGVHMTQRKRKVLIAHIRHYQDRALIAYREQRYELWNRLTERAARLLPDGPDNELLALQDAGTAGATANPIG
jgi:hypothetical protein